VIIYDPDPNPKNEEQAIARSHRIGQTREVKVFHLEAVTDSYNPSGISETDSKDSTRKLYGDSIESIVRNQIQTRKIAMANEIIDAGRFDQQTTNEERRQTLETMLQDSDRTKRAENFSPTDDEINVMLARGDNELELFRRLDKEVSWPAATVKSDLPQWIQYGEKELRSAAVDNAKHATDIQSEIAALTGTVIHHHRTQAGADAVDNAAAAGPTKVRLRLPSMKKAAAMEESSMDLMDSQMDNGPTITGMTNKSGREEDEVTVGNDEEEEVLGTCGYGFLFSCIQSYS
jgi:SWI/SNF-related matrix-associated actin-dependent regulator of chromatin subfamily A protein 2/4